MKHYVLTRSIYDPAICDADMVLRRLEVFRDVTVPSMTAQTAKSATWVLGIHPDDPHVTTRGVLADSTGFDVELVPMASADTPRATAGAAYRSDWGLGAEQKLTTRLDDDDALLATFLERLYRKVPETTDRPRAFVFPTGYRIAGNRWQPYNHPRNMFVSVATPDGNSRNVMNWRHMKIRDEVPTVDVDRAPAWVFFRHDDTISGHDPVTRPISELRDRLPFYWRSW